MEVPQSEGHQGTLFSSATIALNRAQITVAVPTQAGRWGHEGMMKGYPRKTCKKAKAASLSLLCDGEEGLGLAALCEGVGGETCYPTVHRLRRAGRGFCGEPPVGSGTRSCGTVQP